TIFMTPFSLACSTSRGLVDEAGGVQRLSGALVGQLLGSQPAQLIVDQRQQPTGSLRVALVNRVQPMGDIVHGWGRPHQKLPGSAARSLRRSCPEYNAWLSSEQQPMATREMRAEIDYARRDSNPQPMV